MTLRRTILVPGRAERSVAEHSAIVAAGDPDVEVRRGKVARIANVATDSFVPRTASFAPATPIAS